MSRMIQEFLEKTTNKVIPKKQSKQKAGLSNKADRTIKYCENCSYCWEPEYNATRQKSKCMILYYKDFPNYKKPREECPKCVNLRKRNMKIS